MGGDSASNDAGPHISVDLMDAYWFRYLLSVEEEGTVEEHLADCQVCRARVEKLKELFPLRVDPMAR